MKLILSKLFLFSFITLFITTQTFAQTNSGTAANTFYCPSISLNLQVGDTDSTKQNQVSELQKFLKSYFSLTDQQLTVSGIFGNITKSYVTQFQTQNGLVSTGIVGVVTRGKIVEKCKGTSSASGTTTSMTTVNRAQSAVDTTTSSTECSNCPVVRNLNQTIGNGFKESNSALWLSGTVSGSSDAFFVPYAYINMAENATNNVPGGSGINGLTVSHAVTPGAGTGNRAGILGILNMTAPTAGTTFDGQNFYTAIFANMLANSNDGGTPSSPRGNYFAFGGISSLEKPGIYASSVLGIEVDTAIAKGSSAHEKMGLQIAQINGDSVRGSIVDGAIVIVNDRLGYDPAFNTGAHPGWTYGLALGKPGNDWPIAPDGTIIGSYPTINAQVADNGVDFSTVKFNKSAFKTSNFVLTGDGKVGIGTLSPKVGLDVASGVIRSTHDYADFELLQPSGSGFRWVLSGPNKGLLLQNTSDNFQTASTPISIDSSDKMTFTGQMRLANIGAGTLQVDASGNVTSSSDEKLKSIVGSFNKGLTAINGLKPINYHWNKQSGLDTNGQYAGFSAQNVKQNIPEAVSVDSRGYLTLSDRAILATVVNAIKDFGASIRDGYVNFKKVSADEICLNSSSGKRVCITAEQLESIVENSNTH